MVIFSYYNCDCKPYKAYEKWKFIYQYIKIMKKLDLQGRLDAKLCLVPKSIKKRKKKLKKVIFLCLIIL